MTSSIPSQGPSKPELKSSIDSAQTQLTEAKSKIGAFKATVESKEEFAAINSKLTDLKPTISNTFKDAKATLSQNQKEKLTFKERVTQKKIESTSKEEIKNLQGQRKGIEKDTKDLKKIAKDYTSEIKADEKKLEKSSDKLDSLRGGGGIKLGARFFGESRSERQEKIAPQLSKADATSKVESAGGKAGEVTARRDIRNAHISDLKTDQATLKENTADRLKTGRDVHKAISNANKSYENLEKLLANKNDSFGFAGKKIDSDSKDGIKDKMKSLENEIKELKTLVKDLETTKMDKSETSKFDNRLRETNTNIEKLTTETKNLISDSGPKKMSGACERFAFKFFAFLLGKSKTSVANRATELNSRLETPSTKINNEITKLNADIKKCLSQPDLGRVKADLEKITTATKASVSNTLSNLKQNEKLYSGEIAKLKELGGLCEKGFLLHEIRENESNFGKEMNKAVSLLTSQDSASPLLSSVKNSCQELGLLSQLMGLELKLAGTDSKKLANIYNSPNFQSYVREAENVATKYSELRANHQELMDSKLGNMVIRPVQKMPQLVTQLEKLNIKSSSEDKSNLESAITVVRDAASSINNAKDELVPNDASPLNPVAEETPVVETPVVETPVVETPVVETPVAETPVKEETQIQESASALPTENPVEEHDLEDLPPSDMPPILKDQNYFNSAINNLSDNINTHIGSKDKEWLTLINTIVLEHLNDAKSSDFKEEAAKLEVLSKRCEDELNIIAEEEAQSAELINLADNSEILEEQEEKSIGEAPVRGGTLQEQLKATIANARGNFSDVDLEPGEDDWGELITPSAEPIEEPVIQTASSDVSPEKISVKDEGATAHKPAAAKEKPIEEGTDFLSQIKEGKNLRKGKQNEPIVEQKPTGLAGTLSDQIDKVKGQIKPVVSKPDDDEWD